MRLLLVDNYDSYTHNLAQELARLTGDWPVVVRNDEAGADELLGSGFDGVVLSPGPGTPANRTDFGVCAELIARAGVPLLGVCLGHQGIAHAFGGTVSRAPVVMHGRSSKIAFHDDPLFAGVPQGFEAVRYHSLAVDLPLPEGLRAIAWDDDGVVMALRHRERPLWGLQFHPESIGTEWGPALLSNFVAIVSATGARQGRRRSADARRDEIADIPADAADIANSATTPAALPLSVTRIDRLVDPAAAYAELFAEDPYSFWLDGAPVVQTGAPTRFSFIGSAAAAGGSLIEHDASSGATTVHELATGSVTTSTRPVFDVLDELLAAHRGDPALPFDLDCGLVGYFGYELGAPHGAPGRHDSPLPDAAWLFTPLVIAFDHEQSVTYVVELPTAGTASGRAAEIAARLERLEPCGAPTAPSVVAAEVDVEFEFALDRDEYLRAIEQCKQVLEAGESYEICLTNRITASVGADPLELFHTLREINPAPHAALLRFGDRAVVSASPERFLRVTRDGIAESRPIKGTRPRAGDAATDRTLAAGLAASVKDRAENLMIVDLVRNDLGAVCEAGSVEVPQLMSVETYEHAHQLVSTVRGRLRPDVTPVRCARSCFPGGSMTGAPKLRTISIIDRLEPCARGPYSGALGYFGLSGGADLSIVIRSVAVSPDGVSIGAGGAITILSDPLEEHEEMLVKARPAMQAVTRVARSPKSAGGDRRALLQTR